MVDVVITRELAGLSAARGALGQLTARYRAASAETDDAGVFEVIKGADAIRERTGAMLASARTETLNMVKPPVIAIHETDPAGDYDAYRGRLVLDLELLRAPGTLEAIRKTPGSDYQVRVHTLVPVKLLAVDKKMALLPLHHREERPVGLFVTDGAILDSLLALFEYVWETAVTLHHLNFGITGDPQGSPITPDDRRLLSLLVAGLTDQAIADHFHLSSRTVERRVRALMDTVHVRTRTQLAWEAARQKWL